VRGPFDIQIGLCAVVRDPWGNELVILDTSKGLLRTDDEGQGSRRRGAVAAAPGGQAGGAAGAAAISPLAICSVISYIGSAAASRSD
jgi:hypothetical protein